MSIILQPEGATATGAGGQTGIKRANSFTLGVKITGAPTAVTVSIEGGIGVRGDDDVGDLASHTFTAAELSAGFAMFHIAGKPVDFINYNVTTLTGGSSPTVTVSVSYVPLN